MKTYFVEVSQEQTKLFVKEGLETKQGYFLINGHSFHYFYNSCKFDYDARDLVFTPLEDPYLDNAHENVFSFDLEFAGYRYDFTTIIQKFVNHTVGLIDDTGYQLIFFWNLVMQKDEQKEEYQHIHKIVDDELKNRAGITHLRSFFYLKLKEIALGFLSRCNNNHYLYVDDQRYFSSISNKDYIRYRGDRRYEETFKTFSEDVKYHLEDDTLTNQQAEKIIRRAERQYRKDFQKDIEMVIKDRKIYVSIDAIENRFLSGKKRFEEFIGEIASPNLSFTCYLDIETESIKSYTLKTINQNLIIDSIVTETALFRDYIMGYALMLIEYHKGFNANLVSLTAYRKKVNTFHDNYFYYNLSWYRPKEKLLKEINSLELAELIIKKQSKRISA